MRATMVEIDVRPVHDEASTVSAAPLDGAALVAEQLSQLW